MDRIKRVYRDKGKVVEGYLTAKSVVIERGFAAEIDWQDRMNFSKVRETDFLREAGWVILSSGMREGVIRQKFPAFSASFYDWQSAGKIVRNAQKCATRAFTVFAHRPKIDAILMIARRTSEFGFKHVKSRIEAEGIEYIQSMPFMGPATSCHLAKNLGLDVVKPDRHLLRVAAATGYETPLLLCKDISDSVGDRLSVIDLVIWRFATLDPKYVELFA